MHVRTDRLVFVGGRLGSLQAHPSILLFFFFFFLFFFLFFFSFLSFPSSPCDPWTRDISYLGGNVLCVRVVTSVCGGHGRNVPARCGRANVCG